MLLFGIQWGQFLLVSYWVVWKSKPAYRLCRLRTLFGQRQQLLCRHLDRCRSARTPAKDRKRSTHMIKALSSGFSGSTGSEISRSVVKANVRPTESLISLRWAMVPISCSEKQPKILVSSAQGLTQVGRYSRIAHIGIRATMTIGNFPSPPSSQDGMITSHEPIPILQILGNDDLSSQRLFGMQDT